MKEVEEAELGIQLNSGNRISGLLFADDFVGVSDSKENLQKLIDVVNGFCNVSKSVVMVFSRSTVKGDWMWGKYKLPNVSSYTYLGIEFSNNGAWDFHIKKVLSTGKEKIIKLLLVLI